MYRNKWFEEYSLPHVLERVKLWCFDFEEKYSRFNVEDISIHQDQDTGIWVARVWYWMP